MKGTQGVATCETETQTEAPVETPELAPTTSAEGKQNGYSFEIATSHFTTLRRLVSASVHFF